MAHRGQVRISGDAYIIHPLNVAYILTGLHLDDETICAALLHDVVEDTCATLEEMEAEFGKNIMALISGRSPDQLDKFVYRDLGAMATIGRTEAVVNMNGTKMKGFIAWVVWMFVHLLRLAGAHTNTTVLLKWTWNLLSGTRLGRIITNMQYDESRELRPMPLDPEEKG